MNVLIVLSRFVSVLLLAIGFVLQPDLSLASEWNQWRGPHRDGRVDGTDWPDNFSGLERIWHTDLGRGYSGPLVVGDRVFVTESIDRETEAVRALSRETGEQLWQVSWPGRGKVPFFAARNGNWIRSTPLHDGEALYVGGMEEVLVKLDADDGSELWRVNFPQRFGTNVPAFGFVSSPLIDGDALFVQAANSIVKLDRQTGETLWRQLAGSEDIYSNGAFSSPVVAHLAGRRQLLVQTREALHGLDPETGEVFWRQPVPSFRGMNILTPVVDGDQILTSTHRHGTYLFGISDKDGRFESREIWRSKVQGYMSSPVVVGDQAYLHLGNGRVACVELANGSDCWISKPFGKYWSMALQQDKILALDEGGELILVRANPQSIQVLDSQQISNQSTWAHLAVSGDHLFVRELEGIAAYRWKSAAPSAIADHGEPNGTGR